MQLISFKNKLAERVYKNYIQRCRKVIRILSEKDKEECLLEINSHIYEFISSKISEDEMESLLDVLDRLGEPEETLKEIVALKKAKQAINTFNPKHLSQALLLNITNGFIYILLFLLFLFGCCFPILIILKLFYPNSVGWFIDSNDNFVGIGFINITNNMTEIIGNWFIPLMILLTLFIYFSVILLLKIKNKNIKIK